MSQSEGSKQGSGKKRKTDIGDVVGRIGEIWCFLGIIWQYIDLVMLHGADKLYETLHMDYSWVGLWGISNAIFWLDALLVCSVLKEMRGSETITVGVQILGTVAAVVATRIIVWAYAQSVGWAFAAFNYQEIDGLTVFIRMFLGFFASIVICSILSYIFSNIQNRNNLI